MENILGYQGKTCIVTGASSGIGKAVSELLVKLGAKVYVLSRRTADIENTVGSYQVDLSSKKEIDAIFDKLPQNIDCFFGVAGLSGLHNDYLTTFNVDFTANKYMTEVYLAKRMTSGGAILYVTSTAGSEWAQYKDAIQPVVDAAGWEETEGEICALGDSDSPGAIAYFFSKMAMNYYAKKSACNLGGLGIRVNTVLPGSTDTGMKDEFQTLAGGEEQLLAQTGTAKRLATSGEIAWPAVFLNSPLSSFVSGEEFYVDFADSAMVQTGLKKSLYT